MMGEKKKKKKTFHSTLANLSGTRPDPVRKRRQLITYLGCTPKWLPCPRTWPPGPGPPAIPHARARVG
jgi:hypothetical protein